MSRRSIAGLAVFGVLAVTLSACGSSGGGGGNAGSGSSGGGSPKSLDGTDWVLTNMTPPVPELADAPVSATFAHGNLSGHSGCNTYRTTYTQQGSKLTISTHIAGTRIACPSGPSTVERGYLERLPEVASFTVVGSTLTLKDSSGATLLQYQTAPRGSEALIGDWTVTSFYTGTAVASPERATLTASFTADAVSGNGGCNSYRGGVKVDGTDITIGPLASTMMACADAALGAQEQQYLHALELAKTYEIVGGRLSLIRADGGYAVVFERG